MKKNIFYFLIGKVSNEFEHFKVVTICIQGGPLNVVIVGELAVAVLAPFEFCIDGS